MEGNIHVHGHVSPARGARRRLCCRNVQVKPGAGWWFVHGGVILAVALFGAFQLYLNGRMTSEMLAVRQEQLGSSLMVTPPGAQAVQCHSDVQIRFSIVAKPPSEALAAATLFGFGVSSSPNASSPLVSQSTEPYGLPSQRASPQVVSDVLDRVARVVDKTDEAILKTFRSVLGGGLLVMSDTVYWPLFGQVAAVFFNMSLLISMQTLFRWNWLSHRSRICVTLMPIVVCSAALGWVMASFEFLDWKPVAGAILSTGKLSFQVYRGKYRLLSKTADLSDYLLRGPEMLLPPPSKVLMPNHLYSLPRNLAGLPETIRCADSNFWAWFELRPEVSVLRRSPADDECSASFAKISRGFQMSCMPAPNPLDVVSMYLGPIEADVLRVNKGMLVLLTCIVVLSLLQMAPSVIILYKELCIPRQPPHPHHQHRPPHPPQLPAGGNGAGAGMFGRVAGLLGISSARDAQGDDGYSSGADATLENMSSATQPSTGAVNRRTVVTAALPDEAPIENWGSQQLASPARYSGVLLSGELLSPGAGSHPSTSRDVSPTLPHSFQEDSTSVPGAASGAGFPVEDEAIPPPVPVTDLNREVAVRVAPAPAAPPADRTERRPLAQSAPEYRKVPRQEHLIPPRSTNEPAIDTTDRPAAKSAVMVVVQGDDKPTEGSEHVDQKPASASSPSASSSSRSSSVIVPPDAYLNQFTGPREHAAAPLQWNPPPVLAPAPVGVVPHAPSDREKIEGVNGGTVEGLGR
jgi:hypothetical protein